MTIPLEKESLVEEIVPGLTRELLRDGQITAFTLTGNSREVLDAWLRTVDESLQVWNVDRPYLSIQDLSYPTLTVTPYARQRASDLTKLHPEISGRTAVIVSKSLMATLVRGLLHLLNHRDNRRLRKIFYTRAEGIRWLEELIIPPTNPVADQ